MINYLAFFRVTFVVPDWLCLSTVKSLFHYGFAVWIIRYTYVVVWISLLIGTVEESFVSFQNYKQGIS